MNFPADFTPVKGKYTVEERDALFDRISAYPDPSTAADGDVPVARDGKIGWEPQSGGGGASIGETFTVTLTAEGWANGTQTVSNERFLASGYSYIVSPQSGSYAAYATAQIYGDDVTSAGSMTFHAITTPDVELTAKVLKLETVGQSRTYNMISGGAGGSGGDITLSSIAITTPPERIAYTAGDTFESAGMVVEATYSNGAKLVVGGYTVSPMVMTIGTEYVTVTYTEGSVSRTARQAVTVSKRVPTITVSPESVTLDADHLAVAATVTTDSDGEIGVLSNDTGIATASIAGNVITVTAVDNTSGSTTLTVSTAETETYAAGSGTVNVSANFSRLPSGYTELQYLTFSKNQLFKTSIDGSRIQKIDGKFKTDNTSWIKNGSMLIAGPNLSLPVSAWVVVCAQNRPGYPSRGWEFQTQPNDPSSIYRVTGYYDTNTLYEFSIMLPNSLTINGDIVSLDHLIDNRWTKMAYDPIIIGGVLWQEGAGLSGDLYYLNLYDESDEPILLLIPCKRNSDDKLGMYDTVTETFFANNGTGDFIAGPAV